MYVKKVSKNTYRRDFRKEFGEIAYSIGVGIVLVIDVIIAILIMKSF